MRILQNFAFWGALSACSALAPAPAFAQAETGAPAAAAQPAAQPAPAQAVPPLSAADKALVERGRYLAVASDCTACHTAGGGENKAFAGGYVFKLTVGQIVSGNITPSKQFGIGNWSEQDFARAVREGVRPDGRRLYPAMPYPEYSIMTDEDINALYAYFMRGVAPVDEAPALRTKLNFPFNMPGAMPVWNMLFLNKQRFAADPNASAEINRGRYLVDGPAHCGTCHTPRNALLASNSRQYLAGGQVNGWWAPNITSDKIGGIGGWSREELVAYLKTGHVRDKSQAGGSMAQAVELSFRHMNDADLQAIASYLETVPPLPSKGQSEAAYAAHKPKNDSFTQYELPQAGEAAGTSSLAAAKSGAMLYNAACAACHGVNGEGAEDGSSPSLLRNRAVGIANPYSLIMTVAYGLERQGADRKYLMPGFLAETNPIHAAMNEEQIASVVNYVRANFGGSEEQISAATVRQTLAGGQMPFLIRHAALLAAVGGIIGLAVLAWLIRCLLRRRRDSAAPNSGDGHRAASGGGKTAAAKNKPKK